MALTFTIGGTSFGALGVSNARQAIYCRAGALRADIIRSKPKGVSGNYLVRCGDTGCVVKTRMRYLGTVAEVYAAFETDKAAWYNTAVTIASSGAQSFYRCQLESADIVRDPAAMGRPTISSGNGVIMDVEMTFIADGGVTA